ncbi:uncharacterized protein C8Q71DRAFT_534550 [Rhodofomes roseus]|uniref:Uncharacterized protein n=1 Tax=Rhodofomes roseus TaxID=34475 RepID=A0A4Y9Z313_9APHY|nr:uncharacterized protein C8Q71DRAFT_534550 [Rhodofomes roseus]KAH9838529.1 hypothetical protein C8Q71DRAFT_534550 [Rhodofomes roseus]TFY67779.1 hypothetical protein EVJ58_g1404 [Rhodofomes roseus]
MTILYVAHYGHPLLKGAKHWSFLLPKPNSNTDSDVATAYQVTGSTETYEVKDPEELRSDSEQSKTCMGRVEVGNIEDKRRGEFESVVLAVPVTRGNLAWNCQNWIIEALGALKQRGFNVKAYQLAELQKLLAEASVSR